MFWVTRCLGFSRLGRFGAIIAGMLLIFPFSSQALADKRVALVVANSDYENAKLANPLKDADLVSRSLTKAGFDVTVVTNANFQTFDQSLIDFVAKEEGADVALFYFAGHGFAIPDHGVMRNFLMTTSANLQAPTDASLKQGAFSLDEVMERLSGAPKVTLAYIDACRNNPSLSHRGIASSRGFARFAPDLAHESYIVMSTQPESVASDGEDNGKGSPFAVAFADALSVPGTTTVNALYQIRREVFSSTGGAQSPDILKDALSGPVVLVSAEPTPPPVAPSVPSITPDLEEKLRKIERNQQAEDAWRLLRNSTDKNALLSFKGQFAGTPFEALVNDRIAILETPQPTPPAKPDPQPQPDAARLQEAEQLWNSLQNSTDRDALRAFKLKYTGTFYERFADQRLARLDPVPPPVPAKPTDEQIWLAAKSTKSAPKIRRFITENPSSPYIRDARAYLKTIAPPPPPAKKAGSNCFPFNGETFCN